MGAFFSDLLTQLKAIWARLDGGQRLTVASVLGAAVVGLIAIVWVANRPSYVVVHTATSAEQLSEAKQVLGQATIPFEPDGGMSLAVERAYEQQAVSALSAAGLVGGGSSAMSFDEMSGLTADSKMRQFMLDERRKQTALDQILALNGVVDAKITASIPKRRIFQNQETAAPKGSVVLTVRRGESFHKLAPAARECLSSAVEVPTESIVVVDARTGQIWPTDRDGGANFDVNGFEELQRHVAENKRLNALAQLDAVYDGKVRLTVNVELDPEWETRREDILSTEPRPIEVESTTDKTSSTVPGNAGDPSISSQGGGSQAGRPGTTSSNETKKTKYYGKTGDIRRGRLAPDIKRMTCAVMLHKDLEDRRTDIENVIKAAIGWDDQRDPDNGFSVLVDEFEIQPAPEITGGPGIMEMVEKWAPTVVQLVGVLLVLMFLRGLMKKPKAKPEAPILGLDVDEDEEENLDSEEVARRMRKEIERVIGDDPAAVSKMVETWLAEVKA